MHAEYGSHGRRRRAHGAVRGGWHRRSGLCAERGDVHHQSFYEISGGRGEWRSVLYRRFGGREGNNPKPHRPRLGSRWVRAEAGKKPYGRTPSAGASYSGDPRSHGGLQCVHELYLCVHEGRNLHRWTLPSRWTPGKVRARKWFCRSPWRYAIIATGSIFSFFRAGRRSYEWDFFVTEEWDSTVMRWFAHCPYHCFFANRRCAINYQRARAGPC
mmetsp:Transcript_43157/g.101195  ORF Transcript_43157/g.101195 Transcript_43157/m.101195 type:complete len:214 (+) Transcript_43157:684-1325(+)